MVRKRNVRLISLMAAALLLAAFVSAYASEKVITFTKDIDVLPTNTNSGSRINVKIWVDRERVNAGDTVRVAFQTDRDCYLTLIDVGTSRKITRLWPNQFSGPNNFVKAGQRYTFPSATDRFAFKVSGPEGIERIVAYATSEKDKILREEDFTEYQGGFKSYSKSLKDLVVEATQRAGGLGGKVQWGTAEARFIIGRGSAGGAIKSSNVYVLSVGAATGALRYCEEDARRFSRAIGEKLRVPEENKLLVVGQQATKEGFADAIRWLSRKTQPEDLVFIYFSGHGTLLRDRPPVRHPDGLSSAFVCFHRKEGLQPDSPELAGILLLGHDFSELMKSVPARRRLIVVDSCHSGSINKDITGNLIAKYLPLLSPAQIKEIQIVSTQSQPASQPGFRSDSQFTESKDSLLAACHKSESSFEDRSKQSGLFTYWLIETIKGGAPDLQSAFDQARQKVQDDTRSAGLRQTPQVTDEYGLAKDIKF